MLLAARPPHVFSPLRMNAHTRKLRTAGLLGLVLFLSASPASAYIGPGAGFAAAGSVLILLGTFLLAVSWLLRQMLHGLWRPCP